MDTNFTKADNIAKLQRVSEILERCKNCAVNDLVSYNAKQEEYATVCGDCHLYKELREHGIALWGDDTPRKAKKLLTKDKSDVTKEELEYLLSCGVSKQRIAISYGFSRASSDRFKRFVADMGVKEPTRAEMVQTANA